tara:strand:- start:277 stop:1401 length:1125 start_codon:yes stop_codon:yes gene_type:complete
MRGSQVMSTAGPVYLDYNATAPLRPEAAEAMMEALRQPANPSSVHQFGRAARALMEAARKTIADSLNVQPSTLTFTSGGTESNNMVLSGFQTVFASSVEHEAVLAACPNAKLINVDENGVVSLRHLETLLSTLSDQGRAGVLVSVMAANNETGVIQPLEDIGILCQQHNVAFHTDMVQAFGKLEITPEESSIDYLTVSGHKIGAPTGTGAVWCREGRPLNSLLAGGGQEQGRRSGTENLSGICGFAAAAQLARPSSIEHMRLWRDQAEQMIIQHCPKVEVMGVTAARLVNTSCLFLPGLAAQTAIMALDLAGFAISSGSACSSGKVTSSHVLKAMGRDDAAGQVIRISGGWKTTRQDFYGLAQAVIDLYKRKAN